MTKMSETIIFFGNEQLATGATTNAPLLKALVKDGYDVRCLVVNHSPKTTEGEAVSFARKHGIEILAPSNLAEIEDRLIGMSPQIGMLAAYGKIIPRAIIDIFPLGIVNLHPSLLPLHRGPTPIESAILADEQKSGVSIMRLGEKMDGGPVFAQAEYQLSSKITKQELCHRLGELGAKMIVELLPDILKESLEALPQDDSAATYDKLIIKADGKIDWQKPAEKIEREIRAYAGWPGSYTKLGGFDVTILDAEPVQIESRPGQVIMRDKKLFVGCGEGALEIRFLKPAGKNSMPADAFVLGYGPRLN